MKIRKPWDSPDGYDKLRIVAEADKPGATVAEVARRHEISRSNLWAWRKQARAGLLATPDLRGFLPVVVDAVSAVAEPIAASSVPSAPPLQVDAPLPPDQRAITITLANGTRLEISARLSLPTLSCIIGALR